MKLSRRNLFKGLLGAAAVAAVGRVPQEEVPAMRQSIINAHHDGYVRAKFPASSVTETSGYSQLVITNSDVWTTSTTITSATSGSTTLWVDGTV